MARTQVERSAPRKSRPAKPPTTLPTAESRRMWPAWRALTDFRGPFLLPLLLLAVTRVALLLTTPASSEDAFITFRYARNFAAGQGLVYNPGEYVMGFTSPLWTLWSALGIKAIGHPVPWAIGWSVVADVVTLLVGGTLVAESAGLASAWAFTFFFAVWPYFAALAISGMEMNASVALMVLAAAMVHQRRRTSGVALAALASMRPECLVAALVLALGATWRDRIVAALLTGASLGALALTYGSPVPNSLLAKAGIYGTPGPWAGRFWWEAFSPIILGRWPVNSDAVLMVFLAVVSAPAAVLGFRHLWRHRDTALARLEAALSLIWLSYALVGVSYFWWYFTFPLMAVAFPAAIGLPQVVRGRAVPVAAAIYVASVWTIAFGLYAGRSYNENATFGEMAGILRERCRPGESVMLEPIGMIGYTCPLRVIDETGLVSPRVAARRKQGSGWYTDVVAAERPEWLVVRRGVLASRDAWAGIGQPFRSAAERDTLLERYRQVAGSGDPNSDNSLILLRRL